MKHGSHLPPQGVHDGNSQDDTLDAERDEMKQSGLDHEAIGGLFPEGMDADMMGAGMFEALQKDAEETASEGESKLSFDDLMKICRDRLCPVCPTCKEAQEEKLRALADLDNTKKRLLREKEEQAAYASEKVLNDILPALDNLNLALQHAPQDDGSKNFVVGVEMTLKLLLEALRQHGLEEVGAIGEPFDPTIHEAMGMNDIPEIPDNHISSLLSKGYRLKGRLLRPAKVMVCKHNG